MKLHRVYVEVGYYASSGRGVPVRISNFQEVVATSEEAEALCLNRLDHDRVQSRIVNFANRAYHELVRGQGDMESTIAKTVAPKSMSPPTAKQRAEAAKKTREAAAKPGNGIGRELAIGEMATWRTQSGGHWLRKTGVVTEIVPPGELPKIIAKNFRKAPTRKKISYVVNVEGRGLYWPLPTSLELLADQKVA
jgi:hypothetical protein